MRKLCGLCGEPFEAKRNTAKYCTARCRMRASRNGVQVGAAVDAPPDAEAPLADGPMVTSARLELHDAGKLSSARGQAVLALARRIDGSASESGNALAALVKEFRAALSDAVRGAEQAVDPIDELRARRERKFSAG